MQVAISARRDRKLCQLMGLACAVCLAFACTQLADLQRQLGTWWNPINLTIPAGIFYVTQPLTPDVRAQSSNTVSISGQGPDKTILDCQGNTRIAISVSGVSAILLADLTVRNCRPSSAELQRSLVSGGECI